MTTQFSAHLFCRTEGDDFRLVQVKEGKKRRGLCAWCVCAALLAASGCATMPGEPVTAASSSQGQPQSQVIATVQPGDSSLSCAELTEQMAQMDQRAYSQQPQPGNSDSGIMGALGRSGLGMGANLLPALIPGEGGMVALAGGTVASSLMNSSANLQADGAIQQPDIREMVRDRKQHLMEIYERRNCLDQSHPATPTDVLRNF